MFIYPHISFRMYAKVMFRVKLKKTYKKWIRLRWKIKSDVRTKWIDIRKSYRCFTKIKWACLLFFAFLSFSRYMPPVTPSTWKNTRLTDRFAPVCPQLPPVPASGPEALLEVPRERLAQLRRLLPLLTNQSEDCLYLNLYVPRVGE